MNIEKFYVYSVNLTSNLKKMYNKKAQIISFLRKQLLTISILLLTLTCKKETKPSSVIPKDSAGLSNNDSIYENYSSTNESKEIENQENIQNNQEDENTNEIKKEIKAPIIHNDNTEPIKQVNEQEPVNMISDNNNQIIEEDPQIKEDTNESIETNVKKEDLVLATINKLKQKGHDINTYNDQKILDQYLLRLLESQNGKDTILTEEEAQCVTRYIAFNLEKMIDPKIFKYLNHHKITYQYKKNLYDELMKSDIIFIDSNNTDNKQLKSFKFALILGITEIIEEFINNNIILPNTEEFRDALCQSIIIENNNLISIFLDKNPSLINYNDNLTDSIIIIATQYNNTHAFDLIISNPNLQWINPNTNEISSQIIDTVLCTLSNKDTDKFEKILTKADELNIDTKHILENINNQGDKVYTSVFINADPKTIEFLLDHISKFDNEFKNEIINCRFPYKNKSNYTPLILASELGFENVIDLLLLNQELNWENKSSKKLENKNKDLEGETSNQKPIPQITIAAAFALKNNHISIFSKIINNAKSKNLDIINDDKLLEVCLINLKRIDGVNYILDNSQSLGLNLSHENQGMIVLKKAFDMVIHNNSTPKKLVEPILEIIDKLIKQISPEEILNFKFEDNSQTNNEVTLEEYLNNFKLDEEDSGLQTKIQTLKDSLPKKIETPQSDNSQSLEIIIEDDDEEFFT